MLLVRMVSGVIPQQAAAEKKIKKTVTSYG